MIYDSVQLSVEHLLLSWYPPSLAQNKKKKKETLQRPSMPPLIRNFPGDQGSGFRVQGSGFGVQGAGFRVATDQEFAWRAATVRVRV